MPLVQPVRRVVISTKYSTACAAPRARAGPDRQALRRRGIGVMAALKDLLAEQRRQQMRGYLNRPTGVIQERIEFDNVG